MKNDNKASQRNLGTIRIDENKCNFGSSNYFSSYI